MIAFRLDTRRRSLIFAVMHRPQVVEDDLGKEVSETMATKKKAAKKKATKKKAAKK